MGVYVMETTTDYLRAASEAKSTGKTLCATFKGEAPVYFLMDAGTEDDVIRDTAFEIREGRAPSPYERFLLETAQKMRARTGV